MKNEDSQSEYQRIQRKIADLEDIEKQQLNLKRQREVILREQPWYKRPGSIISIIAIIMSIVFFVLNIVINEQKKEITISYTEPSSLVLFTGTVKSKAKISYEQKTVYDMSRCLLSIKNTGNKSIQFDDFKDGPLLLKLSYADQNAMRSRDSNQVPNLLDVAIKSNAGQKQSILSINSRANPSTFSYLPSLLNPGDIVELEIFTSTQTDFTITCDGKISDGQIVFQGMQNSTKATLTSLNYKDMIITGLNGLFGAKWATILIFSIIFIMSLLAAFIFLDELTPLVDIVEYLLISIPFFTSMLFLVIVIFVALN